MLARIRKMKSILFISFTIILLLAFYKSLVQTEDTDIYNKDVKLKNGKPKNHADDFADDIYENVVEEVPEKFKRLSLVKDIKKKTPEHKFSFIDENEIGPDILRNNLKENMVDKDGIPNDAREIIKQDEREDLAGNVDGAAGGVSNLAEAHRKIYELEEKVRSLEVRIPKRFPDVKYLDYKSRKRILITGGAGFVGSHLVDTLMMQGHEIIVVDNFFTGRKRNVEHWIGHENFELIHHDIVNSLFIEVDEIYHLASPASPPHYMYNPVKTIKTNTVGTINMLGLAKRVGAKVLIASTSEVYGDPMVHPQPETYWGHVNPIGPRACYDEGKRVSETLAYAYAKQEHVNVRVARIFNTYGPRMHAGDGRVVSNFVMQALQNLTITVYGNGKQTRSFQYVSDLVDGLVALMASNYTQPVNIGNPEEHTIEEFALIIRDLVEGCKSTLSQMAAVEDDPQRRRPDITRAKNFLGWEPKVPLKEGLKKTIDYFRNELNRSSHSERNVYIPEDLKTDAVKT